MSADVRIRDALVSEPHGHVDVERRLGDVQRRAKVKRRHRFVASATCIVLLLGAATAVVYANGSAGRGPAVSLQPASPDDAPVALPRFLPDASMTIDRIDLSGPYPPQTTYAQIFAANPMLEGPRLSIVTGPSGRQDQTPACGATSGPSRKAEDYGTPIAIGDHNACLYTVAEPSIEWDDPDGVFVSIQSSGLSSDEVIQVAKSVERSSDHEGVALNSPLPAGLSEVMRGAGPSQSPTEVTFHQGACQYGLGVNQTNPLAFAEPGTATTVSGHAALLHENWLGWNPVAGATVGLLVNESGVDATTAVADCDLVGVASRVRQVDNATWDQTLTDLGDRVNRPDQATTTTPGPVSNTPEPQYNGDEAAIATVFKTWISGPDVDTTIGLLEDGPNLRDTINAVRAADAAVGSYSGRVDAVQIIDDSHAFVTFSIFKSGSMTLSDQQGAAIKIDGTWHVSRATYCSTIGMGTVKCPSQ